MSYDPSTRYLYVHLLPACTLFVYMEVCMVSYDGTDMYTYTYGVVVDAARARRRPPRALLPLPVLAAAEHGALVLAAAVAAVVVPAAVAGVVRPRVPACRTRRPVN